MTEVAVMTVVDVFIEIDTQKYFNELCSLKFVIDFQIHELRMIVLHLCAKHQILIFLLCELKFKF